MATKTEDTGLESVAPAPDISALLGVDIESFIKSQVESQLAEQAKNRANPIIDATTRERQAVEPARYLKHYRCDVSPDCTITRRRYDPDQDKLVDVLKGERMVFRRGHFFATEQGEVDQIEWMMRHPQFDPTDVGRIIGGNPTIYEDDGRDLIQCQHCAEPFVRGSNAYKSHLRATHGITT